MSVQGVWIYIGASIFVVLHSEKNAMVRIECGSTVYYRAFHSGASKGGNCGLLSGPRPHFVRVTICDGCWPVFSTLEAAMQFCPTLWPVESARVGRASFLFYGRHDKQYACIECHKRFTSRGAVVAHVGLPP